MPTAGWSVTEDSATRAFRLHFSDYVTANIAREAILHLVERLLERAGTSVVVAALHEVSGFDVFAPVVAAYSVLRAAHKIEHVHIVTRNPHMRVAATAAATIVGLGYTLHEREPSLSWREERAERSASLASVVSEFRALELRRRKGEPIPGDAERHRALHGALASALAQHLPADDQREFLRVPGRVTVTFTHRGTSGVGVAHDLGAGGLFLSSSVHMELGDEVELGAITVDGQSHALAVTSRVAWRCGQGAGLAFQLGSEQARELTERVFYRILHLYLGTEDSAPAA
jgi:hypothetical protein